MCFSSITSFNSHNNHTLSQDLNEDIEGQKGRRTGQHAEPGSHHPRCDGRQVCKSPSHAAACWVPWRLLWKGLRLLPLPTCFLDHMQNVFQNPSFHSHSEKSGLFHHRHTLFLVQNDVQKPDLSPKEDE